MIYIIIYIGCGTRRVASVADAWNGYISVNNHAELRLNAFFLLNPQVWSNHQRFRCPTFSALYQGTVLLNSILYDELANPT